MRAGVLIVTIMSNSFIQASAWIAVTLIIPQALKVLTVTTTRSTLAMGADFADGKGNATVYATWREQEELRQEARDYSSGALLDLAWVWAVLLTLSSLTTSWLLSLLMALAPAAMITTSRVLW